MRKITISLVLLVSTGVLSQNISSKKKLREKRPSYINIAVGKGYSRFVDFATSPLVYSGVQNYISLSYNKVDKKRETEYGFSYSFGNHKNNFNKQEAISKVYIVSPYYSQLYQLNKFNTEKLNIKVGGLLNATGNFRVNESLGNNGVGLEVIPTLFGSIKASKLFLSRRREKDKKLAFRLNVGIINNSFRNGYVYSGQAFILNKPILESVFDDYQFKVFSGFRMNTALDFTMPLKNKNKIKFSYIWEAYKTGGEVDTFQAAHHTVKFTLLFNTNNQ
ncbi:MAG TPA: hypothetical protein DEO36_02085 [Flavobacteriaceae bacterium]|jgi:hypothetical protein|nr:hypothetical protein [Flavobacteriaceae bacterium]